MKEKTGRIPRWLATIVFVLLLGSIIAWTVMANDAKPRASGALVQYEINLRETVANRLEVELPAGLEYVGLAAGSQVGTEPEISSDGGRIVWQGPFTGAETLRFWLAPENLPDVPETLTVTGTDLMAVRVEPMITPPSEHETESSSSMLAATISVTKTVTPEVIWLQDDYWWVTYEAVFTTDSPQAVVLERITDTLPAGFLWGGMAYGSDVIDPPFYAGDDRYVWEVVAFEDTLTMRYHVRAVEDTGYYQNAVEALSGGVQISPASATLQVKTPVVYLPAVFTTLVPEAALPFVDEFSTESPDWEPFTNWPGLSASHWDWAGDPGVWGIWNYEWDSPTQYTGYNLLIYNASGAQNWTDYRVEARVKDAKNSGSEKTGLTGIWFRGTYEDSGAEDGKTVGGYYVYIKPPDDRVYLMRTPPDNPSFGSQTAVTSYLYAPGIGRTHWYKIVVEARGANLKVWFEDDEDGVANPTLIFNWTDPNPVWSSGTVGLATYYTSSRFDYIRVSSLD